MKELLSEFIGTFMLVFAGTSAIVINDISGGVVTHIGVALVFGLIVAAVIYMIGDISGAHINPAVTIGFWMAHRFPGNQVVPYILSQVVGAIAASTLVYLLFSNVSNLGQTLPSGTIPQSFILEICITFILMFTIITVSTAGHKYKMISGFVIGGVVALAAIFAGPVSGASMNPARSIGPAIVSGHYVSLWLYIIAPVIGSCIAILGCRCIKNSDCCG